MIGALTAPLAVAQPHALPLPVILVIGDLGSWRRRGDFLPALEGFHWASYHDLSLDLLDKIAPDVILSPLLAPYFDAMDVAARLQDLGFGGRYRAITMALPNPDIVRREIAAAAPTVDFDIFTVDEGGANVVPTRRGHTPRR